MNSLIEIELSQQLVQKIQRLINEGWFKNASDFLETAGRYYLERHTDEMWEAYVEHEIKAGLQAEY
jgi:Arc/MetJ-type ribon-helix-helix transcriptional regulator